MRIETLRAAATPLATWRAIYFGADAAPFEAACARKGVPLVVERIADRKIAALYERRLVLVRPDGHVAWRGDAVREPEQIIDRVRGAA